MELGTKEFNDSAMEMFGGKPKQQTAVEWLCEQYHLKQDIEIVKQAKEMEKEQQDEFAIGFAEWCLDENHIIYNDGKELLEIYKKENEL